MTIPTSNSIQTLVLASLVAAPLQPQVKGALESPRPHPRLFLDDADTATLRGRIAESAELRALHAHIEASAHAIVKAEPITRKKLGRRLLGVSRTCLKRVVHLAFAYRMSGERRYLERAELEMLAAAAFEDWNPSHFLDVGEMTAALAIGYDWLHAHLSEGSRKTIRDAIVAKGLETSLRGGWWVTTTNNWNQVCHGGLSLGALAVVEDAPELAERILARAVKNLPRAMHEYEPDGAYPEGPGYWAYGTTYNVLLLDALQSALGTDFGLAESEAFSACADYYLHVTGPTRLFFNYSDCRATHRISPAMYWFASRAGGPSLLWHERRALDEFLRDAKPSASSKDRLLPFLLIWSRRLVEMREPATRHWSARGRTPFSTHRSGWDDAATFVAIKGGSPSANHAHMDIGSFVMDANGVRWAHDLGVQGYHSLESKGIRLWGKKQDSQRWSVFRLNNLSHNTLVVDGALQRVKGSGDILKFSAEGPMPHTIVDLSQAYAGQLQDARRGLGLRDDRSVVIQDEITALPDKSEASVRWGMVTRAKIVTRPNGTAILTESGEQLTLRVLSPAGVTWRTFETANPPAPHDAPNPGTRMLGFYVKLPARTRTRITVLLTPGAQDDANLAISPLQDW